MALTGQWNTGFLTKCQVSGGDSCRSQGIKENNASAQGPRGTQCKEEAQVSLASVTLQGSLGLREPTVYLQQGFLNLPNSATP